MRLPPPGARFDYQLGGAGRLAADAELVVRDRSAAAARGVYSVCYLNGFQTQPGERELWPDGTVLQRAGRDVRDPTWPDERLLDTSSPTRRSAIVNTIAPWIRACARAGFRAVEFDNLDSFTRSGGALTLEDNIALATLLVREAHRAGLAAGQKNGAEFARQLRDRAGFDFAVTEECAAFVECGSYTRVYGERVYDIEYTDALPRPFAELCADRTTPAAMILRDRLLAPPGDPARVFASCPVRRG